MQADIFDVNGKLDLSLKTAVPTLKHVDSETHINRATMLHVVDGKWHQLKLSPTFFLLRKSFSKECSTREK